MSALATLQNVLARYSPAQLRGLTIAEKNELGELIEDAKCQDDPLYWAQNWTLTENPHWEKQKLPFRSPFPQKPYFRHVFHEFRTSRLLFVPKSRDMMTSWSGLVWATHQAQWAQAFVIVQTMKDDKAKELLGYADCLYRNQPGWLKKLHPLKSQSASEMEWGNKGRILAVPQGQHQIRTYHPTIYIMDEAAFLPEAEQCYGATLASSSHVQIIAISSAGPGWFADQCSQ